MSRFPNVTVFLEDLLVRSGLPTDALDLSCKCRDPKGHRNLCFLHLPFLSGDKELLESLMFDAKGTDLTTKTNKKKLKKKFKLFFYRKNFLKADF
jgi:hypothetical protein